MTNPAWHVDALGRDEVRVYTIESGDPDSVRAATRYVLARLAPIEPSAVVFDYGPKGKPYFRNDATLRFSTSHADTVSLLAVTRVADIGVDVEAIREVPRAVAIARRFFPPAQLEAILASGNSHEQFAVAWTVAEATVKVRGASIWDAGTPDPSVTTRALIAPPGYAATVAVASGMWRLVQSPLSIAVSPSV